MPSATTDSAIVFGASGSIGRALTERLVASGNFGSVHAGSRSAIDNLPSGAHAFSFDLSDEKSIEDAFEGLATPPAMVIVATGILHDESKGIAPEKTFRALDATALATLFAVNTTGPAMIAKHALARLPRDRRAVFAALSARVGSIGDNRLGGWHAYRASKAALNMLIKNFAIELSRTHAHAVIAGLHPGTVESALSEPFLRSAAPNMPLSPDASAQYLLSVLDGLTAEDSGCVFAWDGAPVPW
jgi:NAD(P)-dependent dehydrogenase (short-subunit alcohol dehydrogenase family)